MRRNELRVALLADPFLFSRMGGIQRQILSTAEALQGIGVDVKIFNVNDDAFEEFQIVHIFDAESCNFKLVEMVSEYDLPIVLSSVISPKWSYFGGWRARMGDRIATKITGGKVKTNYAQTLWALSGAEVIIALGKKEKKALIQAFSIDPASVEIVPNGVGRQFFHASPQCFMKFLNGPKEFVLCVGSIQENKNQLSLVKSLEKEPVSVVLVGPCSKVNRAYLDKLLTYENVIYLGAIDYHDERLSSAYAAASVLALPSYSEVMPNAVMEALATGTPVVMTQNHSIDLEFPPEVVKQIDPHDLSGIRRAVLHFLKEPGDSALRRNLVKDLAWETIAMRLQKIYTSLVS